MVAQQDLMVAQQDPVVAQQDLVVAQQDQVVAQRDPVVTQGDQMVAQQDLVVAQGDPIVTQRDPMVAQQNLVVAQGDPMVAQQDLVVAQGDPVVAQGDPIVTQRDPMVAQQDLVVAQGDPVVAQGTRAPGRSSGCSGRWPRHVQGRLRGAGRVGPPRWGWRGQRRGEAGQGGPTGVGRARNGAPRGGTSRGAPEGVTGGCWGGGGPDTDTHRTAPGRVEPGGAARYGVRGQPGVRELPGVREPLPAGRGVRGRTSGAGRDETGPAPHGTGSARRARGGAELLGSVSPPSAWFRSVRRASARVGADWIGSKRIGSDLSGSGRTRARHSPRSPDRGGDGGAGAGRAAGAGEGGGERGGERGAGGESVRPLAEAPRAGEPGEHAWHPEHLPGHGHGGGRGGGVERAALHRQESLQSSRGEDPDHVRAAGAGGSPQHRQTAQVLAGRPGLQGAGDLHHGVRVLGEPQAVPEEDQEEPQGHERPGLEALVHPNPLGSQPPIIHGNLTSDTVFIQHNGLVKIGSVWHRVFANALPDDLRSPMRIEREELRNLHFFPPEYGQQADGTAVDIFSFGMCALEMAVLEIQTNGDTRVSEEAIARARHSLDDPNMREFILSCLTLNPERRPSANSLLFHRVLFEVHSLKLLAAHCFINHQYLMPENVVEEKIKELDLNMVMAEIRREGRPGVQWRYSEVSFLELDKFLEDVRNGIYPLMNFAASRPLALPRALSQPQEDPQKAKTPTPEPFDVETRKVVQMQCNMELNEDKSQWHLTLLLILEDKLHRQLSYDLLPTDNSKDLATELVHYGFIHEDDCEKLAAFLESAFHKHRSQAL